MVEQLAGCGKVMQGVVDEENEDPWIATILYTNYTRANPIVT